MAAVFETRLAQYLGAISFSLYLFNYAILEVIQHNLQGNGWATSHPLELAPFIALFATLCTIPVAHLSLVYIEKPGIRLGRRLVQSYGSKAFVETGRSEPRAA